MEWYEIGVESSRICRFPERNIRGYEELQQPQQQPSNERNSTAEPLGGIINNGQWGWLARGKTLYICKLSTSQRLGEYIFLQDLDSKNNSNSAQAHISCVVELFPQRSPYDNDKLLLAVCLEGDNETQLAIYTPRNSQVLRYIQLSSADVRVRCMAFLDAQLYERSLLQHYDGCLALGTHTGELLLLDLQVQQVWDTRCRNFIQLDSKQRRAQVERMKARSNLGPQNFKMQLEQCRDQHVHLALELTLPQRKQDTIVSLLPLDLITGFAAGLSSGQILVYSLTNFQLITELRLPGREPPAAVERLCLLLPTNDPKPCFFICALYKRVDCLQATLHALYYKHADDGERVHFSDFQIAAMRFSLVLDSNRSRIIGCAAVMNNDHNLATISWYSEAEQQNKLVLFDMNQWYKDKMPTAVLDSETPAYLCGFSLRDSPREQGLALQLHKPPIRQFITRQEHDEHFYPRSLTFDCALLTSQDCSFYQHVGVQRRFLNELQTNYAKMFLQPDLYVTKMVELRLLPQFCELYDNQVINQTNMYELILSLALEQQHERLLHDCAQYCLDGRFFCNMLNNAGFSLSTLLNWLVQRAEDIKARCAEMCQDVWEIGGYTPEDRDIKEFLHLTNQLKLMLELQQRLLQLGKGKLPAELQEKLQEIGCSLSILYEYQRVFYFLLDRALVPELNTTRLQQLRHDYDSRRQEQEQEHQPRRELFIDVLLRETNLQLECYPPKSLRKLLHVMLLPQPELSDKQQLVLYMLLDLNQALWQDFARAFGLPTSLSQCVQCFWYLDRGEYTEAVNQSKSCKFNDWQIKLLVETLLSQGAQKEAMRLLDLPTQLHFQVLLANDSIPEAFRFARVNDEASESSLLESFFKHCIQNNKFRVLANLCLNESEEQLLFRMLRGCASAHTDSVQLILLLMRYKYIDAVTFMNEVAEERQNMDGSDETILSAYRTTMAPLTQSIAGTYFRVRDQLEGEQLSNPSPVPLSSQLARESANGQVPNIFQSSALSAHWATNPMLASDSSTSLNSRNMPFLRNPLPSSVDAPPRSRVVHPMRYQAVEKRLLSLDEQQQQLQPQPKRPRLLLGEQMEEAVQGLVQRTRELKKEEQLKEQLPSSAQIAALIQVPNAWLKEQAQTPPQAPPSPAPAPPPPHPILKHRSTLTRRLTGSRATTFSERVSQSRFVFNEPLILLPNPNTEREPSPMELGSDQEDQVIEVDDDDDDESDEIIVEIEQQPVICTPSPTPTPSPNADSQPPIDSAPVAPHNSSSDSDSVSDSEYLSPLASANVSLAEQQQQLQEQNPPIELEQVQQRLMAPPTGPQPRSSLQSSGFGSFATIQNTNTVSQQLSEREFVPPVCSSKMCEVTSSQQQFSSASSSIRISERTTISGEMERSDSTWQSMRLPTLTRMPNPERISDRSTICGESSDSFWQSMRMPTLTRMPTLIPRPGYIPPQHQLLDTTLGMSSYDVTALSPPAETQQEQEQEQEPEPEPEEELMEYIDLADDDEPEEVEVEELEEQEQEEDIGVEQSSSSSSEEANVPELTFGRTSPSYSLSSDLSDLPRPDVPVYSIVVESTNSITNSRSPTSHTPTSFLPSDTNVSQNSSPRARRTGEGSARSIYRANSLETVDDLDTTKGSMEEEEEDDCVIALDGTEVRGYVARSEPVAASSSAELFSFKSTKEPGGIVTTAQTPCPSFGATANSDSAVAEYTINLDSGDSTSRPSATPADIVLDTNQDSVETRLFVPEEVFSINEDSVETVPNVPESNEPQAHVEPELDVDIDVDVEGVDAGSNQSLKLAVSDGEEEEEQHQTEAQEQHDQEEEQQHSTEPQEEYGEEQHQTEQEEHEQEQQLLELEIERQMQTRRNTRAQSTDTHTNTAQSLPPVKTKRRRVCSESNTTERVDSPMVGMRRLRSVRLRKLTMDDHEDASLGTPPSSSATSSRRRLRSDSQASDDQPSTSAKTSSRRRGSRQADSPPGSGASNTGSGKQLPKRVTRAGSVPHMPASTPTKPIGTRARGLKTIEENVEATTLHSRLEEPEQLQPEESESAAGISKRSLRCRSEPTVVAMAPRRGVRSNSRNLEQQQPEHESTPERVTRALRSRRLASDAESAAAIDVAAAAAAVAAREAQIPPKKRGRPKK
ncbi:protein ELYS homolog [Drosophila busckii]|uniref:protein ELYS homolog n=1 Tax=Drosophila busckii TaxID=30019 RepID=UPI00083EC680|nr:protein ELYS homolog [Drosophila busckii]